jgi:cytochrome c
MQHDWRRYGALKLLMPIPLMILIATSLLVACTGNATEPGLLPVREPLHDARGDPEQGQRTIQIYGCSTCHLIPGIDGADGMVGPPLTGWADRTYIAGNLPNTPENLIRWIQNPQAIEPGTVMPNLEVTEDEARDIAAYLYTLRHEP